LSKILNKVSSDTTRRRKTEPATHGDFEPGRNALPSGGNQTITTKVGYVPPLKAQPIRKRKDIIPDRTYNFETPPDPVPSRAIKKHINAEVVVVGAGIAGLSATLESRRFLEKQ
jgi:hypothetical protein